MPSAPPADLTLSDLLRTLVRYRWRLIAMTILVSGAVLVYALFTPKTWQATQAVTVRNTASNRMDAPGRFRLEDEMKTTQETLLQMALSREVLRSALEKAGSPNSATATAWPTEEAVEDLRDALAVAPPKGAEFGQTEIIYIRVKDRDRERALQLVAAICDGLEVALNEFRAAKSRGVIVELNETVSLAEAGLSDATERMSAIEQEVGADLIALRMLHQSPTGESDLYRNLVSSMNDLNRIRVTESTQIALLQLLEQGKDDPESLVGAPRELLDSRPSLARLTQGLAELRLRVATLAGKFTEADPRLATARAEEQEVIRSIAREMASADRGVRAAAAVAAAQRASLEQQIAEMRERVDRLTKVRADYSNVAEQVDVRRQVLAEAQRDLAEARAALAAAAAGSQLARIDRPDGGTNPIGPGRTMVAALGVVGGLLTGIGMVFLTAPVVRREELLGERALAAYWADRAAAASLHAHEREPVLHESARHEAHANGHSLVG